MFRSILDPVMSLVYPQRCHVCGGDVESTRNGVACEACWTATRIFDLYDPLCIRCGAILQSKQEICLNCVDASFDAAVAIGAYERALAATIVQLKKGPHLPGRITEQLSARLASFELDDGAAILPIPLSRRRLVERGFNQAEVIARLVARLTGLQVLPQCLVREGHTPMHRAAMDKKARHATVKNAFKVRAPRLVTDRDLLLVDDVLTSGSTASVCAHELKRSGAGKVTVITLARAVMRS